MDNFFFVYLNKLGLLTPVLFMKVFLILASSFLLITACSDKNPDNTGLAKSFASNEKSEDNLIISVEPSENVNLEDYWEEAGSIKSEAEQILTIAAKIKCKEAVRYARTAITLSNKTAGCNNLTEAEHFTGEAGEMVQHAENALLLCEDQAY